MTEFEGRSSAAVPDALGAPEPATDGAEEIASAGELAGDLPLEADEGDAVEQALEVPDDGEDDYR